MRHTPPQRAASVRTKLGTLSAALALVGGCATTQPTAMVPASDFFFVGGQYTTKGQDVEYLGQMYVQRFAPAVKRFPYPIVLIHGTGQTGNNFLGTPDGRAGWVRHFVDRGFETLVVDQPARARSNTAPAYGAYARFAVPLAQYLTSGSPVFPQAKLHTQWPGGTPKPGNPAFDQFIASQVEFLADGSATERLNVAANLALLEKIGPAVFVTHSQAGPFGWLLSDARPDLVKAHVAIEPNGPPFHDVSFAPGSPWYQYRPGTARAHGVTRQPLTFEPPVGADGLRPIVEAKAEFADGVPCYLQPEPARKLSRLAGVPTLILTAQASFRATHDHCTSKFLTQAGVTNTHLRLADRGVTGNSHMLMLELNNGQSAAVIMDWLSTNVR